MSIAEGVNKAPGAEEAPIQIPGRLVLKTQPSECPKGCQWDRLGAVQSSALGCLIRHSTVHMAVLLRGCA